MCEDCHLESDYEDRATFMFEYYGGAWLDFGEESYMDEFRGDYEATTDEEYQDMVDYAEESGFWDDCEGYEEEGF